MGVSVRSNNAESQFVLSAFLCLNVTNIKIKANEIYCQLLILPQVSVSTDTSPMPVTFTYRIV